jgi:hypothetical protein
MVFLSTFIRLLMKRSTGAQQAKVPVHAGELTGEGLGGELAIPGILIGKRP